MRTTNKSRMGAFQLLIHIPTDWSYHGNSLLFGGPTNASEEDIHIHVYTTVITHTFSCVTQLARLWELIQRAASGKGQTRDPFVYVSGRHMSEPTYLPVGTEPRWWPLVQLLSVPPLLVRGLLPGGQFRSPVCTRIRRSERLKPFHPHFHWYGSPSRYGRSRDHIVIETGTQSLVVHQEFWSTCERVW